MNLGQYVYIRYHFASFSNYAPGVKGVVLVWRDAPAYRLRQQHRLDERPLDRPYGRWTRSGPSVHEVVLRELARTPGVWVISGEVPI